MVRMKKKQHITWRWFSSYFSALLNASDLLLKSFRHQIAHVWSQHLFSSLFGYQSFTFSSLRTSNHHKLHVIAFQGRSAKRAAVMCRKQPSLNIAALLITTAGSAGRAELIPWYTGSSIKNPDCNCIVMSFYFGACNRRHTQCKPVSTVGERHLDITGWLTCFC